MKILFNQAVVFFFAICVATCGTAIAQANDYREALQQKRDLWTRLDAAYYPREYSPTEYKRIPLQHSAFDSYGDWNLGVTAGVYNGRQVATKYGIWQQLEGYPADFIWMKVSNSGIINRDSTNTNVVTKKAVSLYLLFPSLPPLSKYVEVSIDQSGSPFTFETAISCHNAKQQSSGEGCELTFGPVTDYERFSREFRKGNWLYIKSLDTKQTLAKVSLTGSSAAMLNLVNIQARKPNVDNGGGLFTRVSTTDWSVGDFRRNLDYTGHNGLYCRNLSSVYNAMLNILKFPEKLAANKIQLRDYQKLALKFADELQAPLAGANSECILYAAEFRFYAAFLERLRVSGPVELKMADIQQFIPVKSTRFYSEVYRSIAGGLAPNEAAIELYLDAVNEFFADSGSCVETNYDKWLEDIKYFERRGWSQGEVNLPMDAFCTSRFHETTKYEDGRWQLSQLERKYKRGLEQDILSVCRQLVDATEKENCTQQLHSLFPEIR